jgi:hypothetical protein
MTKMPKFNLADYETVEERIKKFYELHPDGRIVTRLVEDFSMAAPKTWVFKAFVYLTAGDQAAKLPKATGYASEIDGTGGANNGSAAENSETSAIGRALANMALSGNKRASRQEMDKVVRVEQADYLAQADTLTDVDALRQLYARAKAASVHPEVLERIKERASAVSSPSSLGGGAEGSVSSVPVQADGGKAPAKLLGSPKAGVRK